MNRIPDITVSISKQKFSQQQTQKTGAESEQYCKHHPPDDRHFFPSLTHKFHQPLPSLFLLYIASLFLVFQERLRLSLPTCIPRYQEERNAGF
ncbi:hypothetical protein MCI89_21690 [Muricomes sp. OA1]|uniref:hypothetical protein n=1 Tax=Lachnospiraceae TaxID=186803 RepID=UPI001F05958F|nr:MULTISPECIES: hypothetical protein [Clostridia]MCH1974961.1 hypothetical protein [Muricomes sp. OA1]